MREGYVVRKAAGRYWLIDVAQNGHPYHAPLVLNESGAKMADLFLKGMDEGEMTARLSEDGGVDQTVVRGDVRDFVHSLGEYMNSGVK